MDNQTGPGELIRARIDFKNGKNMTFPELFHTVGHEMVHVKHYAIGQYYDWKEGHNGDEYAAHLLSEMDAYRWNLMNLSFFSFDGALEEFSEQWRKVAIEY